MIDWHRDEKKWPKYVLMVCLIRAGYMAILHTKMCIFVHMNYLERSMSTWPNIKIIGERLTSRWTKRVFTLPDQTPSDATWNRWLTSRPKTLAATLSRRTLHLVCKFVYLDIYCCRNELLQLLSIDLEKISTKVIEYNHENDSRPVEFYGWRAVTQFQIRQSIFRVDLYFR